MSPSDSLPDGFGFDSVSIRLIHKICITLLAFLEAPVQMSSVN